MQPGGKPEIGEAPEAALIRELEEELNFIVSPEELVPVGRFTDRAANEPGHTVSADIFQIATNRASFIPTAEIEEVIWYTPGQDRHIKLAPLTENHLLPMLKGAQAPGAHRKYWLICLHIHAAIVPVALRRPAGSASSGRSALFLREAFVRFFRLRFSTSF